MRIFPRNGYILVTEIETPRSSIIQTGICSSDWAFGMVLDPGHDGTWINKKVMF